MRLQFDYEDPTQFDGCTLRSTGVIDSDSSQFLVLIAGALTGLADDEDDLGEPADEVELRWSDGVRIVYRRAG